MAAEELKCQYCDRDNFASLRSLTQHQQRYAPCLAKLKADLAGDNDFQTAHEFIPTLAVNTSRTAARNAGGSFPSSVGNGEIPSYFPKDQLRLSRKQPLKYSNDDDMGCLFEDDDEENIGDLTKNVGQITLRYDQLDRQILCNFQEYCALAEESFLPFTAVQVTAIKLMSTLRETKASLDTYEAVMEWHLKTTGQLRPHETLGKSMKYLSRKKLFELLRKRYNMQNKYNLVKTITLPETNTRVNIVWNDARAVLESLLTDPRIKDDDYLFFDNDPFKPPPDDLDYIADLNTGLSYIETYKKLITRPGKQILFPTPLYADGCATGQFTALSITAVKIGNGLLTRVARDKEYLWRTLGYIPEVSKFKSRGRRLLLQSGHVDSIMAHQDVTENEGKLAKDRKTTNPQDFHSMLAAVLESYIPLQNSGFVFDFYYREHLYKEVEFIPFVPFIKCDTDEADALCGSYKARGKDVAHLCRYCHCPTQQSDRPLADFPFKTMEEIQALVDDKDVNGLKAISQQLIENATYLLQFGHHNDRGVHGSCPMEMLHALLLGIFKYIRDCFFEQIGPTSQLADEIDALAKEYGILFKRQSDRDMPKTRFSGGIRKGKLMAKEYPGILLCIAAILRSTKGRELLSTGTSAEFRDDNVLDDWILLIESMLEWEMWLKSDKMMKEHVERAQRKHRHLMYLIKKIGKRTKGMGLKICKFHAIMHMAMDILYFGVPMEFDTGSNESGHKPTKTAARLTQKNEETFDRQTGERLEERHLLALGIEEINGRPLWDYCQGYDHPDQMDKDDPAPYLGGAEFHCYFDEHANHNAVHMPTRMKGKNKLKVESGLVDFVVGLQDCAKEFQSSVILRTNHYRNGQVFRGHMFFKGGVWRDWVLIDWGDDGVLPNKIWGFVDLLGLPQDSGVCYGGVSNLQPGLYAIVESAVYSKRQSEIDRSNIFVPIRKEVEGLENGFVTGMKFYLADVEAIQAPAVVVPDIGGAANAYFLVKNRAHWRKNFVKWLEAPDEDDYISSDDEGDSDWEQQNESSDEELEVDDITSDEGEDSDVPEDNDVAM